MLLRFKPNTTRAAVRSNRTAAGEVVCTRTRRIVIGRRNGASIVSIFTVTFVPRVFHQTHSLTPFETSRGANAINSNAQITTTTPLIRIRFLPGIRALCFLAETVAGESFSLADSDGISLLRRCRCRLCAMAGQDEPERRPVAATKSP